MKNHLSGKILLVVISAALLCVFFSFSAGDDPLQELLANFRFFQAQYPQEKVYVQFDRAQYAETDTIYFKAYIINAGGNPKPVVSNILHVDIAGKDNNIVKTFLYPAGNGQAWGSIAVADCMKAGQWHFRAYTNWMRNFDQAYFFKKEIAVGSPSSSVDPAANTFYFYPEGGQLINGLPAKIGYRSVDANGAGIAVKGWISNGQGNKITSIETGVSGIGSFQLTPVAGTHYSALLQYADGNTKNIPLPDAVDEGYQLAVANDNEENLVVRIHGSAGVINKPMVVVAQSNNTIQYAAQADLTAKGIVATLSTARFPTGILQLTLFDAALHAVAERLVYIDHQDQLQLTTGSDKAVYAKNEEAQLSITATDAAGNPVNGTFSVSVTPVLKGVPEDEQIIVTQMMLMADLKERVGGHAAFFPVTDSLRKATLDNLLLTCSWKRFAWNDILVKNFSPLGFQPEESLQISGKVYNSAGKPVQGAGITCILQKGNVALDTVSDQSGAFVFNKLFVNDASAYTLFAKHPDGVSKLVIVIDSIPPNQPYYKDVGQSANAVVASNITAGGQHPPQGFAPAPAINASQPTAKLLQEVVVKEKKLTVKEQATQSSLNLNGPGQADQILTFKDLAYCHELANCLFGKLVGVELKKVGSHLFAFSNRRLGTNARMLVIRDGIQATDESADLSTYTVQDIQSIEVLRSGAHLNVYGPAGANGVLVISTKTGGMQYNDKPLNAATTAQTNGTLYGYARSRDFYAPDFTRAKTNDGTPHTICWLPNVTTGENGQAFVQFFNSNTPGKYKVVVEGVSDDGRPGSQVFYYEVK